MKKKNGFTLIELLAIIVILAIIAVITVPIILNIIEKAKQGAATNSALGYKDAVQKFYTSELFRDNSIKLSGTYTIENGNLTGVFDGTNSETKEIPLSGTAPTSGTFIYENNILKSGCIVVGEYAVTFEDGKAKETEKGNCGNNTELVGKGLGNTNSATTEEDNNPKNNEEEKQPTNIILTSDNDNDGSTSTGDYVKIGDDGFYVLNPPANGKALLIAEYNLDANSRQSANNSINIAFSNSYNTSGCSSECSYWFDYSKQKLRPEYPTQTNSLFAELYGYNDDREKGIAYIYRDKDGNDTPNNIKTYINNYRDYLRQTAQIEDVRVISYEETVMAGCERQKNANIRNCPSWMANQKYWSGSQISGWDYQLYMYNESANTNSQNAFAIAQTTSFKYGIRPVVVVQASLIGR
ncbi:MAG: prepilin-type N-terminal cleavage/methylation domain-containing protein [Bacilli bacterium]